MRKLLLANLNGLLAIALAVAVFALDLLAPHDFSIGILYLAPLLVALRAEKVWWGVGVATLSSILIALDLVYGAQASVKIAPDLTATNRCLQIAAVWIVFLMSIARNQEKSATQTDELDPPRDDEDELADSPGMALWTLIEVSPLALITLDTAGCVQLWNPAAAKIFGWQQSEVLGKPHPIIPWDMQQEFAELLAQAAKGEATAGCETLRTRRDGSVINVSLATAVLRGADGQVISIVEMIEDITERKRAEADRLMAREELLERQRQDKEIVDEQLNKARRDLVASTRLVTVGQMTAQLAHDLRNPLGSIRNAAYYLSRRIPPGDLKWSDYLNMIRDEVETCNRIITSLLDVTRGREVVRQRIELGNLLTQAISRLRTPEAVEFQVECLPSPFEISADPMQLRQVVDNLLKNALDAVGAAGRIHIRAIRPSDSETDVITVSDTGPGVPAELGDSVFELFVTTKAKGTGLGLAICRQIVERHGGRIVLSSEQGVTGAVFRIDLPRTSEPPAPVALPEETRALAAKSAS